MRKIICVIMVLTMVMSLGVVANAAESKEEVNYTKQDLDKLIEKYGVEVEQVDSGDIANDSVFSGNLKELEKILKNQKNEKTEVKDIEVYLSDDNVTLNDVNVYDVANVSIKAIPGEVLVSESEIFEIYDDLMINCTISGTYSMDGTTKRWTDVSASSITQHSSSAYAELSSVDSVRTSISSDGLKVTVNYEITIDKYIAVPIPGVDEILRLKVGTDTCSGRVIFYAKYL